MDRRFRLGLAAYASCVAMVIASLLATEHGKNNHAAAFASPAEPASPVTAPPAELEPLVIPWAETSDGGDADLVLAEGGAALTATATVSEVFAYPSLRIDGEDFAPKWSFPSPTQFGGERVFLVTEQQGDWIKVLLPVRPNGTEGWIRAADVTVTSTAVRAEVNLSVPSLTVWDGDEVIMETAIAHGKAATPTPLGTFYIRDIIPKYEGSPYGPAILALSGFSEVLETFGPGLPALAIHGTNRPDSIGTEASSGCIRVPNEYITVLAETVPLGTPVGIVS